MVEKIIKRDEKIVDYDIEKIKNAIYNASLEVHDKDKSKTISEDISTIVNDHLNGVTKDKTFPTVELIQDIVEDVLMEYGYTKVAKKYILYRKQREKIRNSKDAYKEVMNVVKGYLRLEDWKVNENSNMSYSLQGLNNHISSEVTKRFWLDEIYSDRAQRLHDNGDLHIHDLGLLANYCFTGDTKIKLLDGTTPTIKELAEGLKGDSFKVYSIDDNGDIVPGKAYNARKTRENSALVKVILDNDEEIKCTPDHKFMMRDGSYEKAQNLKTNDSLMPLYSYITNSGYETIWNFKENRSYTNFEYTHRYLLGADKGEVVHHKNGDKRDNRPVNLELMDDSEHRAMEIKKTMKNSDMLEKNAEYFRVMNKQDWKRKAVSERAKNRKRDEKGRFLPSTVPDNHKVVDVVWIDEKEDVYDITVEKHHNFALEAGVFVHNCIGWDLKDLLLNGFSGVPTKVQSSPPKHYRSLLGQMYNFLYSLQGESSGAQAFSNFDTYLAPFVYYDELTYDEVKQGMQEFIFNMNVPTRVGFQAVFSNLTMDLTVSEALKDEYVIVGGEYKDKQYKEFQDEMDMINRAFAEVMLEGDATGGVFPFPIPTYNITEDFDWDNEVLDPLWEMTAKYGIPYFQNMISSDLDPDSVRSMCCRLQISNDELRKRGGGLFGSNPLTGSTGVVTLNMPRIGYNSDDKKEYLERIEELMDAAKDTLELKRKVLENFTENDLYPYSKFYLRDVKKRSGRYWENHFSTIGLNGMNESVLNFMGKNMADEEAIKFTKEVMDFMNDKLKEYQNETGNLYNLEATPK